MELQATLEQYRTAQVRDLVWAILSPTLMKTHDHGQNFQAEFFQQIYSQFQPHLIKLDRQPEPLQSHLEHTTNHRLGPYFERLWLYWLRHNARYKCLAHNVQIQDQGITLGEFDLIVQDSETGAVEHWELAIKFYLGIPPLNNETHWFGPHQKDRLDLKYHHLTEHQLKLSQKALARDYCAQQGWDITKTRLISKGRLFYPMSHGRGLGQEHSQEATHPGNITHHHLRGRWMTEADFQHHFCQSTQLQFNWLGKDEWMVLKQQSALSFQQTKERLQQQHHPHPVQLLVHNWPHAGTASRLFVVPENWLDRALATLEE